MDIVTITATAPMTMINPDSFKPYRYVREINCLTNFLDHVCFATQNLVEDKNQFAAKITKPLPAEITEPQPCAVTNQFAVKFTKPPPAAKITKTKWVQDLMSLLNSVKV